MNLSDVMTRIKYKLGIMNIASPIRNLDGMINTIIKDITVPDFSIYVPDRYRTRIDLKDLEKIENTNAYETYLLPDFNSKKLLSHSQKLGRPVYSSKERVLIDAQ